MKELLIRTASGTVYVLVLIGSILAGPMAFGVVLGLVLFLAVRELILLTGRMDRGWHADLLGVAAML
ncbi:MAG TPA: hypothetical protein P5248_10575, partial [Bacteroidales bacterium]|nr:hypothetical protein [Bacteroidales bacterium]